MKKGVTEVICAHIDVIFHLKLTEVISQLCIGLVALFRSLLNNFSKSALQKLHDLGANPFLSLTYTKDSLIFTLITHKHEKAQ